MQGTLEKFPEEFKITKMETNKLVKGKFKSILPGHKFPRRFKTARQRKAVSVQNTFHIYIYRSLKIAETSRKPRNSAHIRHGNVMDTSRK